MDEQTVGIFHGASLVATHALSREPVARIVDPQHFAGLWRPSATVVDVPTGTLAALERRLSDYAETIAGGRNAIVHEGVVEQLTRLHLRCVAERLDAVLSETARTEATHLEFLDTILREETAAKQRTPVTMGLKIAHGRWTERAHRSLEDRQNAVSHSAHSRHRCLKEGVSFSDGWGSKTLSHDTAANRPIVPPRLDGCYVGAATAGGCSIIEEHTAERNRT
ncbi:MAG: hypothetical protein ACM3NQ_16795 [Bacteroidales bacterium]